jgi:16S rRNA (uracil1498-N3)-methyltransferase
MRKIRVFVDLPLADAGRHELPQHAADHLTRVLRLRNGFEVHCFNGDGHDYRSQLLVNGKWVAIDVLERLAVDCESPLDLTLAQSIARGEKMDWILQKATELGATRIAPIVSERTEVTLDEERADRRMNHWRRVIESAAEQCGRARLPELLPPAALASFGADVAHGAQRRLFLHPEAALTLEQAVRGLDAPILLAIGPEGGWSERDQATLGAAGFEGARLGPRVLRTETAGVVALSVCQSLAGDFRAAG